MCQCSHGGGGRAPNPMMFLGVLGVIAAVLTLSTRPANGQGLTLAEVFGGRLDALNLPSMPNLVPPSGGVCPVKGGARFSDTWGAPRSGGRRHKGVDMLAPAGTPLVAVTDARVIRAGHNTLGGLGVTLRDAKGTEFYYAHNSANLVRAGQQVRKGQMIARVGSTGNAAGGPPHLHFEVRPGGQAVNPTPYVRRWC